jgi:PLP dependent protein
VAEHLQSVRDRITAAGGAPDVRVLAVTKGFGPSSVLDALAVGLDAVGENYAQELVAKSAQVAEQLGDARPPAWHFLGAVQRNKVRALAPLVDCWQGVARRSEGEAIARHAPGADVLVQVGVDGAPGRNGCPSTEVPGLVDDLCDLGLRVRGLMVVAPVDPVAARSTFADVRRLADRLGLAERSMGMSDDLEAAVAEGSTMVRIGRGLFGDRPPRHQDR